MQILLYITDDKDRYLGGDPLTLYMEKGAEREGYLAPLAKTLRANVIQMNNGDHLMYVEDD